MKTFIDNDGHTYTYKEIFDLHNLFDHNDEVMPVMTDREFSKLENLNIGQRLYLTNVSGWIDRES